MAFRSSLDKAERHSYAKHEMTKQEMRTGNYATSHDHTNKGGDSMEMDDLERMKLTLDIYHGLCELAPEDIEKWREMCLDIFESDSTQEFVNMAADMALKPECMKK